MASDPLTALAHTINKAFKDNTDAVLKASGSHRKATSQEEQYRRVVDKVNNETFPTLAEFPTVEEVHYWYSLVVNQLRAPHWTIDHFPLTHFDDGDEVSDAFKYRSAALCRSLIGRLTLDKHMDALDEFVEYQEAGHGVSLLKAVKTYMDPQTDQLAMTEFQEFCGLVQQNGDTIQTTSRNIKRSYDRLKKAGFVLGEPMKVLQLVKAVITGAYAGTPSFQTLGQDIIQGHLLLKELDYESFVKRVTGIMASAALLKDNKAVKISATRLAGRRAEGGSGGQALAAATSQFTDPWFGETSLDELSSKAQFQLTNCLCCRNPKNHGQNHHMHSCDRLKKMGYTIQYTASKDERLSKPSAPGNGDHRSKTQIKKDLHQANEKVRLVKKATAAAVAAKAAESAKSTTTPPDEAGGAR